MNRLVNGDLNCEGGDRSGIKVLGRFFFFFFWTLFDSQGKRKEKKIIIKKRGEKI